MDDTIPESLDLLEFVADRFKIREERPFVHHKILAIQHLLGSTVPFFNMLQQGGASPSNIVLVGKAYSSHPEVVHTLIHKGYNVDFNSVFEFNADIPYESTLESHIIDKADSFIRGISENEKGLIIDDGGKAIKLLHNHYSSYLPQFACVEQTSRGARVVSSLNLGCPVANVARSEAKTIYESPAIAKGMVEELTELLSIWEENKVISLKNRSVLVLGYGFIGQNVVREFIKFGYKCIVYDPEKYQLDKARADGINIVKDKLKALPNVSIVVGCSGTPVMSEEEMGSFRNGTLVVNMASTDTEFSAWLLRPKGQIVHERVRDCDDKYLSNRRPLAWRSLYHVKLLKNDFYLVNGGFPSDFSGKINPIPIADIQLTSALLLTGLIQAMKSRRNQFLEIDPLFQKDLLDQYLKNKENS